MVDYESFFGLLLRVLYHHLLCGQNHSQSAKKRARREEGLFPDKDFLRSTKHLLPDGRFHFKIILHLHPNKKSLGVPFPSSNQFRDIVFEHPILIRGFSLRPVSIYVLHWADGSCCLRECNALHSVKPVTQKGRERSSHHSFAHFQ